MNKRRGFRVMSILLVNSFLFFGFTCAGAAELIKAEQEGCLSPSLQINTKIFSEYFAEDNPNSFIDQLIAAGMINSSANIADKLSSISMKKIWEVLVNMPGSRIKELKGVVTFKNHQTEQTQDKFEHTQMLADFEQGLDENRVARLKAREIISGRKDPGLDELDSLLLDNFLDYYNQISQNELKLLRFAIALHDLGNIYGKGENHFASKQLSEQVLDQFIDKGIIDEQEYKVIIALVYLHNTFNTIHYGEMMPDSVSKYLDSENVNKELYFKLAPILYIADVGSVAEGRLSDRHLVNALFMSQEENVMSLIHNWQSVRLNLGFCGQSNIIIDFTKMHNAMPEYIQHNLDLIRENNKQQFDYFWNDFMLQNSSFGGHAVYIFRYLNDLSKSANDNESSLVKFLYLISLLHKQNPQFEYTLFTAVANDQEFARKLQRIFSYITLEQIELMFANFTSLETIEKQLGIALRMNGKVLEVNVAETEIIKPQDFKFKKNEDVGQKSIEINVDESITYAMIKPDGYAKKDIILDFIKQAGFEIVVMQERQFTQQEIEQFYAIHKDKPFFAGLIEYISSGTVVQLVLRQKRNKPAFEILRGYLGEQDGSSENSWRKLLGVEKVYKEDGTYVTRNKIHGSDSMQSVIAEIGSMENVKPVFIDTLQITDKTVSDLQSNRSLNSGLTLIGQAI